MNGQKEKQNATVLCRTQQIVNIKIAIVIFLVLVLCMTAIGFTVITVKDTWTASTELTEDINAVSGTPNPNEKFGYKELEVTSGYKFALCGSPANDGKNLKLCITNPSTNEVCFKLNIYQDDKLVASTDLIYPGKYIESIELDKELTDDKTPLSLKLIGYNSDYTSAGNVNINISVLKNFS